MNEELDSQLSAMFDDELPAAECELLAPWSSVVGLRGITTWGAGVVVTCAAA